MLSIFWFLLDLWEMTRQCIIGALVMFEILEIQVAFKVFLKKPSWIKLMYSKLFVIFWQGMVVVMDCMGMYLHWTMLWRTLWVDSVVIFLWTCVYRIQVILVLSIFEFSFTCMQGKFLEKIKSDNPGVPCFLFGHSTGGAVVLKVMSLYKNWKNLYHLDYSDWSILISSINLLPNRQLHILISKPW